MIMNACSMTLKMLCFLMTGNDGAPCVYSACRLTRTAVLRCFCVAVFLLRVFLSALFSCHLSAGLMRSLGRFFPAWSCTE